MTTPTDTEKLAQALRELAAGWRAANPHGTDKPMTVGARIAYTWCAEQVEDLLSAHESRAQPASVADEWVMVPREPTEQQWDGLARDIVMWWCFDKRTGAALFRHLENSGREIPDWLREEVDDIDHVPPKGTVAAIIYRAMIAAAPRPPAKENAS